MFQAALFAEKIILQFFFSFVNVAENEKIIDNKAMRQDIVKRVQNNLYNLKNQIDVLLTLSLSDKTQTNIQFEENNLGEKIWFHRNVTV